jgi:5-methylcytosine-specific restriction endonuclease McrA
MVEPIRIKSEFSFVGTTTLVSSRDKENDDIAEDDEDVASASHASSVLASFRPIAPKPASRRNPLIVPTAPKTFAFASPAAAKHASTTKHPFKYVCPFCGKRYTSRSGLLSHKNTIHYQRKPYRCQLCNDHFFTSAQRVAHIHRRHADQGHDIEATIMRAKPGMQQQQEQQQLRTKTTTHVVEKTYSRVPALSPMKKLALAAEASGAPKRVSIVSVSSSKSSIIMSNGKTITLDLGSQSSVELKKRLGSGGCVAK